MGVDTFIPLSAPNLDGREWEYAKECLDSGWVSSAGAFVDRFESEFANVIGATGAVCTSSGTASLHLALLLAGVRAGQEVLVPSLTFIAPVNTIRYVGAHPVFVDSDPHSWQMDIDRLATFLERECDFDGMVTNRTTGRRVAAILPVHILGYAVDLRSIYVLAEKYGLKVIEDATESLNSKYGGRVIGSQSHTSCFSFNGNKLMTTGGGGMFVSRDEETLLQAKHLSTQAKADKLEYIHDKVGYNYRLPNLLAALGCAQLEQLAKFCEAKTRIAKRYDQAFSGDDRIQTIVPVPTLEPVAWLYTVKLKSNSRSLIQELKNRQIESRPLWQPNHLSPAHAEAQPRHCPVAEDLYAKCISLPCSTNLTEEDQDRVISTVQNFL